MIKSRVTHSFFALVLSSATVSEATVVVSNLSNPLGDAWTIGRNGFDPTDSPVANRFTTGSGPGWRLDSVVLNLGRFEFATGSPIEDIDIYLAADGVGVPGASLTTFPSASPTNSVELISRNPDIPIVLAPNTAYWLVTSANVADQYQWNFTEDVSQTGLPGWLVGDTAFGGYPAGGWTPLILPPGATPAPTQFEVNATAIPEPGSVIGLAGILGLALCSRRRRG